MCFSNLKIFKISSSNAFYFEIFLNSSSSEEDKSSRSSSSDDSDDEELDSNRLKNSHNLNDKYKTNSKRKKYKAKTKSGLLYITRAKDRMANSSVILGAEKLRSKCHCKCCCKWSCVVCLAFLALFILISFFLMMRRNVFMAELQRRTEDNNGAPGWEYLPDDWQRDATDYLRPNNPFDNPLEVKFFAAPPVSMLSSAWHRSAFNDNWTWTDEDSIVTNVAPCVQDKSRITAYKKRQMYFVSASIGTRGENQILLDMGLEVAATHADFDVVIIVKPEYKGFINSHYEKTCRTFNLKQIRNVKIIISPFGSLTTGAEDAWLMNFFRWTNGQMAVRPDFYVPPFRNSFAFQQNVDHGTTYFRECIASRYTIEAVRVTGFVYMRWLGANLWMRDWPSAAYRLYLDEYLAGHRVIWGNIGESIDSNYKSRAQFVKTIASAVNAGGDTDAHSFMREKQLGVSKDVTLQRKQQLEEWHAHNSKMQFPREMQEYYFERFVLQFEAFRLPLGRKLRRLWEERRLYLEKVDELDNRGMPFDTNELIEKVRDEIEEREGRKRSGSSPESANSWFGKVISGSHGYGSGNLETSSQSAYENKLMDFDEVEEKKIDSEIDNRYWWASCKNCYYCGCKDEESKISDFLITQDVYQEVRPSPIKWTVAFTQFPLAYEKVDTETFCVTDILEYEPLAKVFREEVFKPNLIGNIMPPSGKPRSGFSNSKSGPSFKDMSMRQRVEALISGDVDKKGTTGTREFILSAWGIQAKRKSDDGEILLGKVTKETLGALARCIDYDCIDEYLDIPAESQNKFVVVSFSSMPILTGEMRRLRGDFGSYIDAIAREEYLKNTDRRGREERKYGFLDRKSIRSDDQMILNLEDDDFSDDLYQTTAKDKDNYAPNCHNEFGPLLQDDFRCRKTSYFASEGNPKLYVLVVMPSKGKDIWLNNILPKKSHPASEYFLYSPGEPFSELFNYADTIVHHGGNGVRAEATMAAKPQLVVAHGIDQPFQGANVKYMGNGDWISIREYIMEENNSGWIL